jgi:hypothetical protein
MNVDAIHALLRSASTTSKVVPNNYIEERLVEVQSITALVSASLLPSPLQVRSDSKIHYTHTDRPNSQAPHLLLQLTTIARWHIRKLFKEPTMSSTPLTSLNFSLIEEEKLHAAAKQFKSDSYGALEALQEFEYVCAEQQSIGVRSSKFYEQVEFDAMTKGLIAAMLFVKEYSLDRGACRKPFYGRTRFSEALSSFGLIVKGGVGLEPDETEREQYSQDAEAFEYALELYSEGFKQLHEKIKSEDVAEGGYRERDARLERTKIHYQRIHFFRVGRKELIQSIETAISKTHWTDPSLKLIVVPNSRGVSLASLGDVEDETASIGIATVISSRVSFPTEVSGNSQSLTNYETHQTASPANADRRCFTPRLAIALAKGFVPEDLSLQLRILSRSSSVSDVDNARAAALQGANPRFRAAQRQLTEVLENPQVAQRLTAQEMLQIMRDLMLEPTSECSLAEWKNKVCNLVYANPHRILRISAAEPKEKERRKGFLRRTESANNLLWETADWWTRREARYLNEIRPKIFADNSDPPRLHGLGDISEPTMTSIATG